MTKEVQKKLQLNIYKAVLLLEKQSADVFFMLKKVKIETSDNVPTACVGFDEAKKLFKMIINTQWALDFNTFNLAAIIEHELLHVLLHHCTSIRDVPSDKRKLLNIAQDAIINDIGSMFRKREQLNGDLKRGVFFDRVRDELNNADLLAKNGYSFYDFTPQKITTKELYDLLLQMPEDKTDQMQNTDEHGLESGELPDDEKNILKEISQSDEAKKIIDEISKGQGLSDAEKKSVKNIGQSSADFSLILKGYYKAERIKNFKKAINTHLATSKASQKISTLKRPSRRFSGSPYGKIKTKKNKIKLCLDSSGSQCNEECYEKINIAICNALDLGFEVDCIIGDTAKTGFIKNMTKKDNFQDVFKGGGGTELSFFFEDKDDKSTSYVIVTDGYFNKNDIPEHIKKSKILMLSTSDLCPIFDFKTLKIGDL